MAKATLSTAGLFMLASLIWGSTWLVITFQLGTVAHEISVAYRFALAAALLGAWCIAVGRSLRFPPHVHAMLAAQGFLFFGLNYVAVYKAEQYIASGLVAVLFSTIVFMSLVGVRLTFGTAITRRALLGATLGVTGVALLMLPEMRTAHSHDNVALGIAFGLGAAFLATGGNLMSMRLQRAHLPILETTALGVAYGALFAALAATLEGAHWAFDASWRYVASLAYLAVIGSIIAFVTYLTLLKRIGAGRASYVGVATPVIAMLLSSAVEGTHFGWTGMAGIGLAVVGNVIVLGGHASDAPFRI